MLLKQGISLFYRQIPSAISFIEIDVKAIEAVNGSVIHTLLNQRHLVVSLHLLVGIATTEQFAEYTNRLDVLNIRLDVSI